MASNALIPVLSLPCPISDSMTDRMRNNFDLAVTFLLPTDPIAKKIKATGDKRPNAEVSAVEMKQGTGTTGVELRYHSPADYIQLKDEQKKELKDWRTTAAGKAAMAKDKRSRGARPPKGGSDATKSNKKLRKTVASILAEEKEKITTSASEVDELQKCLVSFMSGVAPPSPAIAPTTVAPSTTVTAAQTAAVQLQGILRRGRGTPE